MTKSAAIREYLAKHPSASPADVAKALSKNGVKVTPQLVSNVKLAASKKPKTRKRKATATPVGGGIENDAPGVQGLQSARSLLEACNDDFDLAVSVLNFVHSVTAVLRK